jgi:iron complex outermembrane receptor protein
MSVPFNMTNFTEDAVRNLMARTIGEVVENDPAVRTAYGYGNFSEVFVIRGFPLNGDDVGYDGLYGVAPRQLVATDFFSNIELMKGANAFLNGAAPGGSGIGGGVNLVPKRAGDAPLTRVTADFMGDSTFGGSVDASRRFGPDGAFGVRVNGAIHSGDTAVDDENRDTKLGSLDLDYRSDKVRLSFDIAHQRQEIDGGRPVVYVSTVVPKAPSASYNYAEPWSYSLLRDTFGQVRGEYDVLPNVTVYGAFGARETREDGDYASPTITKLDGTGTVGRLSVPRHDLAFSGQGGVRATLHTGDVSQQINVGASQLAEEGRYAYELARASAINLYTSPLVVRPATYLVGGNVNDPRVMSKTDLTSFYASDTLGFLNDTFLVTGGLRQQNIRVRGWSYASVLTADYQQSKLTPVAGLVFKATDNLSFYANRIEGLAQGPTAPTTAINAGQVFAPYTSTQYEVGAKYDTQRFGGSLALFKIEQPTGLTDPNTRVYAIAGNQRNQGVELSLYGEPIEGVRLMGGASYIDATYTQAAVATNNGNDAVGVPDYQVTLGAEYDLPWVPNLTLTGHVIRTGEQYVDAANKLRIPGWTRVDLGGRYSSVVQDRPVTFRLDVENVAGESYWSSSYGGYLTQGAPRTVKLSVSVDL